MYDKFTATADAKPGVKKLKNGETFRMFAMDDADWERLTIIRDFLTVSLRPFPGINSIYELLPILVCNPRH